jgi:hypothetical protein
MRHSLHERLAVPETDHTPAVLAVGLSQSNHDCDPASATTEAWDDWIDLSIAATATEALELLKIVRFELLLVGSAIPDMSTRDFAATMRRFWPWQRWALIDVDATESDVQEAGELGAIGVFDCLSQLESYIAPRPIRRRIPITEHHPP